MIIKNSIQKNYCHRNFIPSGFTNIDLIDLFEQKTKNWLGLGCEEGRNRLSPKGWYDYKNNKQKK